MTKWQRMGEFLGIIALLGMLLGFSLARAQSTGTGSSIGSTGITAPTLCSDQMLMVRGTGQAYDPFAGATFAACEAQANAQSMQEDFLRFQKNPEAAMAEAEQRGLQSMAMGLGAGMTGGLGTGLQLAGQSMMSPNACPGTLMEVSKPVDCTVYKQSGKYDPSRMKAAIDELMAAQSLASCKIRTAKKAATLTSCFASEFDKLKAAMNDVQKDFAAYATCSEKYLTSIDMIIGREKKRSEQLKQKQTKLAEAQRQAMGLYSKFMGKAGEDSLTSLINKVRDREAVRQRFTDRLSQVRTQRTAACFSLGGVKNSPLRNCKDVNGNLVNPKECLFAIYYDSEVSRLTNGAKRSDPSVAKKAAAARANFEQSVNLLMSDFSTNYPRKGNVGDFLRTYKADFDRFGAAGKQMKNELLACDQDAQDGIKTELASKDGLGGESAKIDTDDNIASADLGAACQSLGDSVKGMSAELGASIGISGDCNFTRVSTNTLNTTAGTETLQAVDLRTQLTNVKSLSTKMYDLLNTQVSKVDIPDGNSITCYGVVGCQRVAEQQQQQAETNMRDLDGDGTYRGTECGQNGCPGKKRFVKEANNLIKTKMSEIAELFGARVNAAMAQFDRVKQLLGQNDLNFPGDVADRKKTDVSKFCSADDAKICNLGGDFGATLADMAGVPKVEGRDFDSINRHAREREREYMGTSKNFKNNIDQLIAKGAECQKESDAKEKLGPMKKTLGDIKDFAKSCDQMGYSPSKDWESAVPALSGKAINLAEELQADCEGISDNQFAVDGCAKLQMQAERYAGRCKAVFDQLKGKEESARLGDALKGLGKGGSLVKPGSPE